MAESQRKPLSAESIALVHVLIDQSKKFDADLQTMIRERNFDESSIVDVMFQDVVLKLTGDELLRLPEGTLPEDLVAGLDVVLNLCHTSSRILAKQAAAAAVDTAEFQSRTASKVACLCMMDPRIATLALADAHRILSNMVAKQSG